MSSERSSYWIVAHTQPIESGASTETTYYNLVLEPYDIEDLVLQKGHILHCVYVQDADRDGLGDRAELLYGTDPNDPDTDDDGATDYLEINGWMVPDENGRRVFPSPFHPDTDGDGLTDYEEYLADPRTDPTEPYNRPPAIEIRSISTDGLEATLQVSFSDPDVNDRIHVLYIDWGDGHEESVAIEAGQTGLVRTHRYPGLGSFAVEVWGRDGRNAVSTPVAGTVTFRVPDAGLVAWWPLNGNARDATGTYHATYAWGAYGFDRFGFPGSAATLGDINGETHGVIFGPAVPIGSSVTISAWIRVDAGFPGGRIAGQVGGIGLFMPDGNRVAFGTFWEGQGDGFTEVNVVSPPNANPANEWTHWVGTLVQSGSGSTLTLYRNGELVASRTVAGTFPVRTGCTFLIGHGYADSRDLCTASGVHEWAFFAGSIDDVRVFDRALTDGEIYLLSIEPDTHLVIR